MNWTSYFLQVNLYLVLFYTFYWLFLRRETFFKLNRIYLVGSAFFSALIPLMKTEFMQSFFITKEVQQNWANLNIIMTEGFASPLKEDNHWLLGDYLTLIYFVMVLGLFARLIYRLIQVSRLLKTDQSFEAFSFFKTIRINKDLPQQEMIEKHEMAHAKEFHSADVIFFEVLSIINWFNPVVYFYKRSVKHIHEFIADQHALEDQDDKSEYAMLLFSKSFGVNPHSLTNTFFNQSILKKRIEMMNKKQSKRTAILKYGLSVPLFLLAMILSSAKISKNKTIDNIAEAVKPKQKIEKIFIPDAVKELVIEPTTNKEKLEIVKEDSVKSDVFQSLKKHLSRTLKYPEEAKSKGVTFKVAIQFNVSNEGFINNVKALALNGTPLTENSVESISSYKDKLDVKSQDYTIFIKYNLDHPQSAEIDATHNLGVIQNFIGEISVFAYAKKSDPLVAITVEGQPLQKKEGISIYSEVENLPSFPGGIKAFGEFLGKNINYPEEARKNNIQGRVFCTFVVEKDGGLSDIKVVRGIGAGCDAEAVRVLALSPKWNPGMQKGEAVRVSYTVPISFQMGAVLTTSVAKNLTPQVEQEIKENISAILDKKILLLIDGVIINRESQTLSDLIKPDEIESINVLKNEAATKKYGEKGKYGVVEIISKKKK